MPQYVTIADGEEVAGIVTPVAPRRSFKWTAMAAAAVGLATIGYMATPKGAAELAQSPSFESFTETGDELTLSITNEDYYRPPASLGTDLYQWSYNVEPHRLNYLSVSLADET
jgi:hypothetical protein